MFIVKFPIIVVVVVVVASSLVNKDETRHHSLVRNFVKCLPIFKILSLLHSEVNLK